MNMNKTLKVAFVWQCYSALLFIATMSLCHAAESEFVSQWVALGNASFKNGVQLPMYGITVENPIEGGVLKDFTDCHHAAPKCRFNMSIPPALKGRLQLIQVPTVGVMLVPRDWHFVHAAVGVDGSASVGVYAQPKDGFSAKASYFSYYTAGGCVGCAYSSAAVYFDNAIRLAQENGFSVALRPANLHLVKVNAKKAIFSRPISDVLEMNGVAYFDPSNDDSYLEKTVILPVTERALATVLLNFKGLPLQKAPN